MGEKHCFYQDGSGVVSPLCASCAQRSFIRSSNKEETWCVSLVQSSDLILDEVCAGVPVMWL